MSTTAKTVSALLLAALLSAALFLSPVSLSRAQEDDESDQGTQEQDDQDDGEDGRGPGRLSEEEREALHAEREAMAQAFLDDVAAELDVTAEELIEAFKTAAINQIEAKVEAGDLDEDRAAEIIERIEEADGIPFGGPGLLGGHRGGHHGPRGW